MHKISDVFLYFFSRKEGISFQGSYKISMIANLKMYDIANWKMHSGVLSFLFYKQRKHTLR